MTQPYECVECQSKKLTEHTEEREELGRKLAYKYHTCDSCGERQMTYEDLQWNADRAREFYSEHRKSVMRGFTWQQRTALIKAQAWCFWEWVKALFEIPDAPYRVTVTTDIEGKVVAITTNDDEHRVRRVFWK